MENSKKVIYEIKHLRKSFGKVEVLKDISMKIENGEVCTIIGPSGSGKSTFLRCLNLLEKPTGGELWFEGKRVNEKTDVKMLRRDVGMVFQSFNLFPMFTAVENVMYAPIHIKKIPRNQAREEAMELLARVGLAERADYYPGELSGGQQKRVGIARALAVSPRYIVFDESISGLDVILRKNILELLKKVQEEEQCSYLFITHEIDAALYLADEIHVMQNGELIESCRWNGNLDVFKNSYTKQLLQASHLI